MTLFVLDTDHLSLLNRNNIVVVDRVLTVRSSDSDSLCTTVVNFEEQVAGRLAQIRRVATDPERLVSAYARLSKTFELFARVSILKYGSDADGTFRELRKAGVRIGTQDLRIASIVLVNGGVLVTRNRRDFEKVPELSMQDWSV